MIDGTGKKMSCEDITTPTMQDEKGNHFLLQLCACVAIVGIVFSLFIAMSEQKAADMLSKSVEDFVSNNSAENLSKLKNTYRVCWQDSVDGEFFSDKGVSWLHISCTTRINNAVNENRLNVSLLFNSLINANESEFALEMGFFDKGRIFGETEVAEAYTKAYEGNNFIILKNKTIYFVRHGKPKKAYDTAIKAFLSTPDLVLRHEMASIARGILTDFGCVNDMKVWENYSMENTFYGTSKPINDGAEPLSFETLKVLRDQLDNGTPVELQDSCSLKNYKL